MQRGPGPRDPRSPSQRSQARASPWGWQKWVCGRAVCRGSRRRHVLLSNMIIRLFDYFLSPGDGKRCAGASLTRLVGRLMRPAQHASASMVFLGRGGRGGAARFRAAQRDVLNNRSVRGFIQRDKNRNHGRLPPEELFRDRLVKKNYFLTRRSRSPAAAASGGHAAAAFEEASMSSSMCDAGASIVHRGSMCARGWTGQDKVGCARSHNLASAGLPSVKPT